MEEENEQDSEPEEEVQEIPPPPAAKKARTEVENLAAAINASTKQANSRKKQASKTVDKTQDECAKLRDQLRQVRFLGGPIPERHVILFVR